MKLNAIAITLAIGLASTPFFLKPSLTEGMCSVKDFGAIGDGVANDTLAVQDALDTCQGGTVYFPPGVYMKFETLIAHSNTTLKLNNATVRNMPECDRPVISCDNPSTNITIQGGLFDGNRAAHAAGTFATMDFLGLTYSKFIDVHARGGARYTPGSGGDGEGLVLRLSHYNEIRGGLFYENDYDGIKLRGANYNTISGVVFRNNERSGVQLAFQPGSVVNESTVARNNTITGCTVFHSTGLVGGGGPGEAGAGAAYVSGFGIHGGMHNTIAGNTVRGTACGVDFLEGGSYNVVSNNVFHCKPSSSSFDSAIWVRWYNSNPCIGNVFEGNQIRGISGANQKYILNEGGRYCTFSNNLLHRDTAATSGTWTVTSLASAQNNRYLNNFSDATTFGISLAELNPVQVWLLGGKGKIYTETGSLKYQGSSGTVTTLGVP